MSLLPPPPASGHDLQADEVDLTRDSLVAGGLSLLQPRRGHRFGTDAVLLAAHAARLRPAHVVDLGAATGAVGLLIARLAGAGVTLVERDERLAALCRRNAAINGLAERVSVVHADALARAAERRAAGLLPGMADCVATNPPWYEPGQVRLSPVAGRSEAHAFGPDNAGEAAGALDRWLRTAADLLKPRGTLVLIHRAQALAEILAAMAGRFGGIVVRAVHPRAGEPATRILVWGTRGSRADLAIAAPFVLHEADGSFTAEAVALHERGVAPPW